MNVIFPILRRISFLLFITISLPTAGSQQRHSVVTLKSDFAQLYQQLQEAHRDLYVNISKPEYDALYHRFLNDITHPMNDSEARIYFQRFVALGNIAHARIDLPVSDFMAFRESGGRTLPLYPSLRGNRAFVENYYGNEEKIEPGQEIISINDTPVAQWVDKFSQYLSADNQAINNTLLEMYFPYMMWLEAGAPDTFTLTVKTKTGPLTLSIDALDPKQQQASVMQRAAGTDEPAPLREYRMLDGSIGYLRPGPFYNAEEADDNLWDATAFKQLIDDAFTHFQQQQATALLIDLRDNPGGTNSFSDYMIAWFADQPFRFASDFSVKVSQQAIRSNEKRLEQSTDTGDTSHILQRFYDKSDIGDTFSMALPHAEPRLGKQFEKPVFVLINRYSYSNAVSVAAIIQDYGFGTLIGEKTADLATTYGAMEHFTLPETGIEVGFPKALIVRPNGSRVPDGVSPDIRFDFDAARSDDKSVLKKVAEIIRQNLVDTENKP